MVGRGSEERGRTGWRIVELDGRGHRLWYVSLLLRHLAQVRPGTSVQLVTGSGVMDSAGWREHIAPWQHVLGTEVASSQKSRRDLLLAGVTAGSYLVIPDADTWLVPLLAARFRAVRPLRGSILLMRSQPNFELGSKLRHVLKKALLVVLRIVHPRLVISSLAAVGQPGERSVVLDPVAYAPAEHPRDEWLVAHDLDPARRWLVVLGEVSERKCIGLVLDALLRPAAEQAGWALLVIGKPSNAELAERLATLGTEHPGRIVFRNSFVSDVEFDTWVTVADAVSVLYKNEGSSGVLLKCWAAGATVIVGGSESVLTAATELDLRRVAVTELSADGIARALLSVATVPVVPKPDQAQWHGRSDRFARVLLGLPAAD